MDQNATHGRDRGDVARGHAHLRRANEGGDVIAVEQDARLLARDEIDPDARCQLFELFLIARIDALTRGSEAEGAIHRAGVDVRKAKLAGDEAAGGGFANAGGTVDGDDAGTAG